MELEQIIFLHMFQLINRYIMAHLHQKYAAENRCYINKHSFPYFDVLYSQKGVLFKKIHPIEQTA